MKIAILGGGPTGCSLAYFLRQEGYTDITLYEKEAVLGGCAHTRFYNGIPYEFGPQILYTEMPDIQAIFERFVVNFSPPTPERRFVFRSSHNGTLADLHDFPVTVDNILKLPENEAKQAIWELSQANQDNPDFSNFESYVISRMGETLYRKYIEGYTRKAWCMEPRDITGDWLKFRPLSFQRTNMRFGKWQGHPGNYNRMWNSMIGDTPVVRATVTVDDDIRYYADGDRIDADLIFTTLPLSNNLQAINYLKIFVVLRNAPPTSVATTFPNHYKFIRIYNYNLQYETPSDLTLLDFAFPWMGKGTARVGPAYREVVDFVTREMPTATIVQWWPENRSGIYPLATQPNIDLFFHKLQACAQTNVIPLGRAGMHAYVSKDTCVRMAKEAVETLPDYINKGPSHRLQKLIHIRRDLR